MECLLICFIAGQKKKNGGEEEEEGEGEGTVSSQILYIYIINQYIN